MNDFENKYPEVNNVNGFIWEQAEPLLKSDYNSKVLELVIPDIPISDERAKIINMFVEKHGMTVYILKG